MARARNIGTFVMKPLAGGALVNRRQAFRFFNERPVDVILNGVSSPEALDENLAHVRDARPLSTEELAAFEAEVEPLGREFCRRCSYCMPCPNDLMIHEMIHVTYQAVRGRSFEDLPPEKQEVGRNLMIWLEACEECGQCEEKCPYELPVIRRKNELMELFAGQ